jgi:hypothetical protein
MTETAADAFDLQVRLGRFLPRGLVVGLAFVRNFVVALVTEGLSSSTATAPQWVLVTRKADGARVGRVRAGRKFGDGDQLLSSMSRTLVEHSPNDFLDAWHVSRT